jgi:S-disulfanyl-L-cysteine oxidoreductase SoxD
MRRNLMTSLLVLAVALFGAAHGTVLTHLTGVNSADSEWFEAEGTWALTLAAYCSEGFGFVEATVFDEDDRQVGVVTVMGEGIQRGVFEGQPGRYYVEVYTSYQNVYDWELLVEDGEGSPYEERVDLLAVSHAESEAAEHGEADHDHGEPIAVPDSIWDGVFTAEQAARGRQVYEMNCSACHGTELVSEDGYAPDLSGFRFTSNWHGKTLAERFEKIQTTMPLGRGGTLQAQEVVDILAHILNFNKYTAGEDELVPGPHLEQILIEPQE